MGRTSDPTSGRAEWLRQGTGAVVAAVGSVLLGNACILVGGLLAIATRIRVRTDGG